VRLAKLLLTFFLTFSIAVLGVFQTSSQNPIDSSQGQNQTEKPRFSLPIKCKLGEDCFVQLYGDRDLGKAEVDWGCGRLTYDGHTGTDFAIPNQAAMKRGVQVLAVASGKVLRVRDGIEDKPLKDRNDPSIKGKECGNGVVVDHGNDWQTQYCHFRRGSVVVKPGDLVNSGSQLGLVGQSGMASFPHVHFEIRHQNRAVDPFMGETSGTKCQTKPQPLWQNPLQNSLTYISTGFIDAGFTNTLPTLEQAEQGISIEKISKNAESLIFWIRAYGVLEGDEEKYQIIAPDRTIFSDRAQKIPKSSKSWFSYTGKKRNNQTLTQGQWQGKYSLIRNGNLIFQVSRKILVN
jgi:murein DD-endopeptidase